MPSSTEFITKVHEERISRLEEQAIEQAAEHAGISSEFKTLTSQMENVNKSITTGFADLSEKISKLSETVKSHTTFIDTEKKDREDTAKKKGKWIKVVSYIALPLVGAVGANSGKSIYEWIVRIFHG